MLVQSLQGDSDFFLREHFRHCIAVNLLGGDVTDEINHGDIARLEEDLGLVNREDSPLPLDDPKWHTPLGKEVFQAVMETSMASRLAYSDDEESEDDYESP